MYYFVLALWYLVVKGCIWVYNGRLLWDGDVYVLEEAEKMG